MNETSGSSAGPAAEPRSAGWSAGMAGPADTWWARRPRRSVTDRKIAGVAGGLGRALGVDPVVLRVAFVVLTVFGGFGGLLYLLGWLLLPGDGDEVSAAESLLGRGRSSVPPVVAVGLVVLLALSAASTFSWGTPIPLIVIGVVVVMIARKRGGAGGAGRNGPPPWAAGWDTRAQAWGEQAQGWVARQPWATPDPQSRTATPTDPQAPRSPFTDPPLWDEARPSGSHVRLTKDQPAGQPTEPPAPPAWDPLGAAPFAWDLPEPGPAPAPPGTKKDTGRGAWASITVGLALLAGAGAAAGVFAGWWGLSWAAVAAIPLSVIALGLLIGSLRGRGGSLVGPGVFLSIVTVGLAMTGLTGTDGFGEQQWRPTSMSQLQSSYLVNGGQGVLDLRGLTVPAGTVEPVSVTVRTGQAQVLLPAGMNVEGSCQVNVGSADCLGETRDGLNSTADFTSTPSADEGTLRLTVTVGAGEAEVRRG